MPDRLCISACLAVIVAIGVIRLDQTAASEPQVGAIVFAREPGTPLKYGEDVVGKFSYEARVVACRGKWIEVRYDEGRTDAALPSQGFVLDKRVVTLDDAVEYFTEVTRDRPRDAWGWICRAKAWRLKGELRIAIRDLDEALRLNPNSYVHNLRGVVEYERGEYDRALADFDRALQLDSREASAYVNRGHVRQARREYAAAVADYDAALVLTPRNAIALCNRGSAKLELREIDAAIADLDEAIRLEPGYAAAYDHRGIARCAKREFDQAIASFDEAIRLGGSDFAQYVRRGNAHLESEQFEAAIADYDVAIQLAPRSAYGPANRAIAFARMGDGNQAKQGFEAALRLDPLPWVQRDFAYFLATHAKGEFRNGQRAVALAREALDKAGQDASWKFRAALAAAEAEAGDFAAAVAAQERALADAALAESDRERMQTRLECYRAKQPWRE